MQNPVGTLASDGNGAQPPADDGGGKRRPGGSCKFVYASGSQPLNGFTIKRGIGVGGFGEVYYATTDAGKDVALKYIQRNLDVELRGVRQCLNLKHPNLLALFDIRYDEDDRAWVVMEYVAGESLHEVIQRNPNGLPPDQADFWLRGIAKGLAYLHDHGIVHRDMKPGNLFLDEGIVKIGDYGLSKFISCSRRSGQTESVGTFHYMAPEIGRGRYGKEIDVYALGIILYEMLTGRVPYDGESSQEIIMKHLTAQPQLDVIPLTYRSVISTALAKDPNRRFRSVEEMLHALPAVSGPVATAPLMEPPLITAEVVERRRGDDRPTIRLGDTPHAASEQHVPRADAVHPARSAVSEEPVARAVRDACAEMQQSWRRANLGNAARFTILALVVLALVSNAAWLSGFAITAAFVYVVYLLIRAMVVDNSSVKTESPRLRPAPPPSPPPPPVRRSQRPRARRRHWEELARQELAAKLPRERLMELTGSLLLGAAASAVCGIVMVVLGSEGLETSFFSWGPLYAWITLSSIMGVWSVLVFAKLWEFTQVDPSLKRFTMLAVGLATGAAAYGFAKLLMVEPTYVVGRPSPPLIDYFAAHAPGGMPTALGYLGYFGGLYLVPRWWNQADPMRPIRLSIWLTVLCTLWAYLLFLILPFPRGVMVAAAISIAVQLSAPWVSDDERKRLRRSAQEASI